MPRRPTSLLTVAAACAGATVALWFVVNHVSAGRRLDARIGDAIHGLNTDSLYEVLNGITTLADAIPYAVAAVALVALAWLRGGVRLTSVAALILLAGNAATQLAQPALTGSRHVDFSGTDLNQVGSWPSGHATAAALLALVAILVAGPRLRPIAAVAGLGYVLVVDGALVILGEHLPGDVVAGILVAGAFTALGACALSVLERRRPAPRRPARAPQIAPALGALAAFVVFATATAKALITRPDEVVDGLDAMPLLLGATFACALAVGLSASWALVRR